jgi:hypothetical protein
VIFSDVAENVAKSGADFVQPMWGHERGGREFARQLRHEILPFLVNEKAVVSGQKR